MKVRMIALCSIVCFSITTIKAPDTQVSFKELCTAGVFFTALGAVPVAATNFLLDDHSTPRALALAAMATPGVLIFLSPLSPESEKKSDTLSFKKAAYLSVSFATVAYGASKLTNNTIAPLTFGSCFFTGLGTLALLGTYY